MIAPPYINTYIIWFYDIIISYFAEWSLLWLDAIISLRMSEIRLGGVNNGR